MHQAIFLLDCTNKHWVSKDSSNSGLAAVTQYQRLGGLNNSNEFLTALQAGKTKVKGAKDLISRECLLPGSKMATFSVSSRDRDRVHLCMNLLP